jgi:hypothetical protein
MAFCLRDGLSWCECAGRAVFLDLERDRYFRLPDDADAAFRRWAASGGADGDPNLSDRLERAGLLVRGEGAGPPTPAAVRPPVRDLAGESLGKLRLSDVARAVAAQRRAQVQVRHGRLADLVRAAARDRAPSAPEASNADVAARRVAAAFESAALILRKADQCVPRALAARALGRRLGIRVTVVFGVRLEPFAAHCWAQWNDAVIVGDLEEVRLFTPILVVP